MRHDNHRVSAGAYISMNRHELIEMLARIVALTAFVIIPCLCVNAYRGWVRRLRPILPPWRNFVGAGSIVLTLINWLGISYLAFAISTHRRTDYLSVAGPLVVVLVSAVATVLSLALKGHPRVWAFIAAALMTGLLGMSYLAGAAI